MLFAQAELTKDSTYLSIQKIPNDSIRTERSLEYLNRSIVRKLPQATALSNILFNKARKQKDSLTVGRLYSISGFAYLSVGEFDKAYTQYYAALPLIQKYGKPKQLVRVYEDMSWIQIQLKDYQKAESSLSSALDLCNKYQVNDKIGEIYGFYGILKDSQLKFDQAVSFYRKALPLNKKYGTKFSQISGLVNLAISQRRLKQFPEALTSLFRAKAISDSLNNDYFKQSILQNIGEVAYDNKDYKTAETYIVQALKSSKNNTEPVLRKGLITLLKKIYSQKGDYKASLMYADSLEKLNEGIFAREKIAVAGEMETRYQVALKDDKLAKQALLSSQQQQEIELKKHQLELISKENEIERLALLRKQAQLENDSIQQVAFREKQALLFKLNNQHKNKQIANLAKSVSSSEALKVLLIIILCFVVLVAGLLFYNYQKSKRLNAIITLQKSDLEVTGQVKDLLFSVVSHDMRSPINTLIAFTQLLELGDVSTENMKIYGSELARSLNHTSALMDNLLNWALSQMQGFKPEIKLFDVCIIAGDVVNNLKENASRKNLTMQNNIPSGTLIMADINMLQLVIRNLVSNAIKFTKNNGLLELNAVDCDWAVSVSIRDNGIGLSPEFVDEFNAESYSHFSDSTPGTNNEKGNGLGLMLCKNFTILMNGTIEVRSEKGKGSLFLINMPKAV